MGNLKTVVSWCEKKTIGVMCRLVGVTLNNKQFVSKFVFSFNIFLLVHSICNNSLNFQHTVGIFLNNDNEHK